MIVTWCSRDCDVMFPWLWRDVPVIVTWCSRDCDGVDVPREQVKTDSQMLIISYLLGCIQCHFLRFEFTSSITKQKHSKNETWQKNQAFLHIYVWNKGHINVSTPNMTFIPATRWLNVNNPINSQFDRGYYRISRKRGSNFGIISEALHPAWTSCTL